MIVLSFLRKYFEPDEFQTSIKSALDHGFDESPLIVDAVKQIVFDLDSRVSELELGEPSMSSHNYIAYPFDSEYLHEIGFETDSSMRLAFIDGGNQELLGAPNFSIQMNRIYFNLFEGGGKRLFPKNIPQTIEFLSLTTATSKGKDLIFETSLVPILKGHELFLPQVSDLKFGPNERRILAQGSENGGARPDIARVSSVARRFAEWEYANQIVKLELNNGDMLVMDGTLRTAFPKEMNYAQACYSSAKTKGVTYCGLSKSSRLLTTTGLTLIGAIRKLANDSGFEKKRFYYFPIAESKIPEHEASLYVIRLSEQSKRAFRFEIQGEQDKKITDSQRNTIFNALSLNSTDFALPGYPYGLIDADSNARVSEIELEPYRVVIMSEISKIGSVDKFVRQIEAADTHEILNRIREVVVV